MFDKNIIAQFGVLVNWTELPKRKYVRLLADEV